MKEILKKDLLAQINEQSMEVDELADFKKQGGIEKKWEPIMSEPQDSPGYEGSYKARGSEMRAGKAKGSHIGHKIIDKTTGEAIVIIYPCLRDINEFIAEHQNAINSVKEEYGQFYISTSKTNPTCEPRVTARQGLILHDPETGGQKLADTKVRFETEYTPSKYIKTYLLYPTLNKLLSEMEVNQHLEKCSLPRVKVSDRANLDSHSSFDNQALTYQTLNFNSYKDVRDFFNSAVRKVQGVEQSELESEYREYHLARQFNNNYRRWEDTKKNQDRWMGTTPIYNLEALGLSPTTFDVTVSSLLTIKGQLISNGQMATGYKWEAFFTTKHGKKLKENNQLARLKMVKDYELASEGTVQFDRELDLILKDEKDLLVRNEDIVESITNCLTNLFEQIKNIPVQDQLNRAKLTRFELSSEERDEIKIRRQERLARLAAQEEPAGEEVQGEEQPQLDESIKLTIKGILSEFK